MELIATSELTLAVTDLGQGAPLLLCHPYLLDSTVFDGQLESLGRERRLILVDFPGFGHSPKPQGDVSFAVYAKALREVLARKQIARVDALGLSMGSYALLELQRQAPLMLRRLVLVGARAGLASSEQKARHEAAARRVKTEGIGWLEEVWVPILLRANPELPARRIVSHILRRASPQGVAAAALALAGREDQTNVMRTLTCSTLIVQGADDRATSLAEAEALTRLIPQAQLEVLTGAGHLANVDEPERFNRLVVSFLQS